MYLCNECLLYKEDLNDEGVCKECYYESFAIELKTRLFSCKTGNCKKCPKLSSIKGNSNYSCKRELLEECYRFFEEFLKEYE